MWQRTISAVNGGGLPDYVKYEEFDRGSQTGTFTWDVGFAPKVVAVKWDYNGSNMDLFWGEQYPSKSLQTYSNGSTYWHTLGASDGASPVIDGISGNVITFKGGGNYCCVAIG